MAEKNIMQGGVAELTKIRKLLENQADLKKQVENLQSEKKRCEVEIESEEKAEQAPIESRLLLHLTRNWQMLRIRCAMLESQRTKRRLKRLISV